MRNSLFTRLPCHSFCLPSINGSRCKWQVAKERRILTSLGIILNGMFHQNSYSKLPLFLFSFILTMLRPFWMGWRIVWEVGHRIRFRNCLFIEQQTCYPTVPRFPCSCPQLWSLLTSAGWLSLHRGGSWYGDKWKSHCRNCRAQFAD